MSKGMTPAALGAFINGDIENFIVASTPGGIEAQEKAGQQSFVNSSTLPIVGTSTPDQINQLTRMGIVLGSPVDDLFRNVTLPAGWTKKVTDHDMWSKLLDEKGRERAHIFYKAAFYDRSATFSLSRRFLVESYTNCTETGDILDRSNPNSEFYGIYVSDCGVPTKFFGAFPSNYKQRAGLDEKFRNTATKWLEENYPDYQDAEKYWE